MGMRNSKNIEEYSTDNMEFESTLTQKLNLDEKDSIILVTNKYTESNENKSINMDINLNLTEELNKSTKENSTFDNKEELVPFKFEWKEEDNNPNREIEVMLTGTFLNNWDSYVKMDKNPDTNIYEYEILLPKAKHFFKYIINNKWKCSDLYPTEKDNSNNINNYIDLTNYNKKKRIRNIFDNDCENYTENKIKNEKIKKRKKIINNKNNDRYGQKFPLIKDLNLKAPTVMIHNKDPFSLENQSNQKELGNQSFYSTKEKDYSTANTSYKSIFIFPHEKLSHLVPNIDDILSTKNYNRYSITQRKKHKYLTIVYYKPK
jgi:hypothetical protein